MYKERTLFFTMFFLSLLSIIVCAWLLPYIPAEICIAGTYSEAAIEKLTVKEQPETEKIPVVALSEVQEVTFQKNNLPITIQNDSGLEVDINTLLKDYSPPLKKTILIVHTHATEGYAECDNRSLDNTKNMVAVGKALKESLESYGFSVIHDETHHDYPNYNGSYANSLKTVENYIKQNPDINIVLDLHRDGIEDENGQKVAVKTVIDGVSYAKLMFVVGTNASGLYHENWKENLKFAAGLQSVLGGFSENIVRPLNLRYERFNQHTTKNSIIVEVGSNGNNLDEAIRSAKLLAKALSVYIRS